MFNFKNFILLIILNFFFFFYIKKTFATKDFVFSKIKELKIDKRFDQEKLMNKDEKIERQKYQREVKKQSFEDLQNQEIIPDVIISIDSEKAKDDDIDKLFNKLKSFKDEGKKINYFSTDNLKSIYIYLYNGKSKLKELKEQFSSETVRISPNRKLVKQYTPNDPYYSSQWNLNNINWSRTMDIGFGGNQITIGIIDNGVDVDDLELSSKIWQNPNEVYEDSNDNDNNGYIDDKYGCNFYMRINKNFQYISCQKENIKEDLIFDLKHGTYVAQVAAAKINNLLGIAGVCPTCKIAVLNISYLGEMDFSLLPYVFNYAIDKDFKVLNLSALSICPFGLDEDVYSSDINNLINIHGIMLVQAAGNYGNRTQSECVNLCGRSNSYCYSNSRNQAYYYVEGKNVSNKINVASINFNNQRSSFSNYDGSYSVITVSAPGEDIPVYPYRKVSGTSFSAPMVSGTLGLYLSLNFPMSVNAGKIYNDLIHLSSYISDASISRKKLDLFALISQTKAENLNYGTSYIAVSRFWSDSYKGHLYSTGEEAKSIIRDYSPNIWRYEGIVYHALKGSVPNSFPVYRFWSDTYKSHFYTQDEGEKNYVINNYPINIWRYEGISFYAYLSNNEGKLKIYRFWSDVYKKHFYAAGEEERDYVINNLNHVWKYEHPAWSVDLR